MNVGDIQKGDLLLFSGPDATSFLVTEIKKTRKSKTYAYDSITISGLALDTAKIEQIFWRSPIKQPLEPYGNLSVVRDGERIFRSKNLWTK